jgi:PAS domain S-box-containing protein
MVDTAIAVADVFTSIVLFNLLVFGPLIAATRARPRDTAIVGVYALALGIYEGIPHGFFGTVDHIVRCAAIAATGVLAVWGAWLRERTEAAQRRSSVLAEAGALLGASLDDDPPLQDVARLVVRRLSAWCTIDVVDEEGRARRAAAAHAVPAAEARLRTARPRKPNAMGEAGPSCVLAPLQARGRTLGVLAFGSATAERRGEEDLALARELAVRCAAAIDNARLYRELGYSEDELRRSSDELGAILDGVADSVVARDASGRVIYANEAAADLFGVASAADLRGTSMDDLGRFVEIFEDDGRPAVLERLPGRLLLEGEPAADRVQRVRALGPGTERWVLVKARPVRDEEGELLLTIVIFEDVTERRRHEESQRFLAEGTKILVGSLDYEATLRNISRLVVPRLADWCAVDVLEPGGTIRNVATAHGDPARVRAAEELRRRYPPAHHQSGVAEALRSGRSSLYADIPEDVLIRAAEDPEHLALLRELGLVSAMVVPMPARGRILGAISLVAAESGRRYDEDDLALAEELGRRCALAVDNARLYGERSHIARTLQESLLPSRLPVIPGFEVAARFHAAGEGIEVGGDFFDLFELDDGSWAAVIGDVTGKGAEAAAVTAMARYTVRAVAAPDCAPSDVLRALNDAVLRQGFEDRFCTVAFARLHAEGGDTRVELSSGGHPLPLLVRPDGTVDAVGRHGTALGVTAEAELEDREVALADGDKLVFYTDGVIEARVAGRLLGEDGLGGLLRSCGDLDTVATGDHLERAVIGAGEARDDIAVLVLRARGPSGDGRGDEGLARSGAMGREGALNLRLGCCARAPGAARAALDALNARAAHSDEAHRARLLLSEVVTNSVRHGGCGPAEWIALDVELSTHGLRVEVSDQGAGFAARRPVRPDPDDEEGRGLYLVDRLADRWGVAEGGRRVWFELDRDPA